MTANEMADWLDKKAIVSFTKYIGEHLELTADVLRQQQSEIGRLKQQYELYGAVWHDEHGYQFTATVGEKVLNDDRWIKLYRKVEK